ncbi:MAG TPA: ATP-binding protein [Elusimicrobiota bacterium]|jgi:DNA replication ATP-dependent helicase Dna2|nr:ATP-binding protein [Elusimicrobiota bacterium]
MKPETEPPEEAAEPWTPQTRETAALKEALEREHLAQQEGLSAHYDRPVSERVASGLAVEGLVFQHVLREKEQDLLVFAAPKNDSRLRPGARLRLSQGDPRKPTAKVELVDDRYDGKKYIFRLSGGPEDATVFETAEPWVLDEDVFDLLDLQLEILEGAEKAGLASWLAGSESAPTAVERPDSPFAAGLSDSALEAFRGALATSPLFAVQGPPGSGKTHLLARLALHYAVVEDARVLITAVSHQAIHQALAEVYWVGKRLSGDANLDPEIRRDVTDLLAGGFFKLGASRGNNEGLPAGIQPRLRAPSKQRPIVAGGTVYSATLHAAGKGPGFDVVLFDEAGQAPLILALGARLLAPKVVYIGDDAQLPPVVASPSAEDLPAIARRSALGHIRAHYGDPPMLAETRRLNAGLCSVISDCFYGGGLAPTPEAQTRRFALKRPPAPAFAPVFSPDEPFVFVDVPHADARSASEPEARWAASIAAEAVRCGLAPQDLGVIAPYRAQCNRIRFLLGGDRRLAVATVERFQGQEREMVVVSLTSSNPRYLARLAGFLFSPNRLNVAISRARTKAIVLGSAKALRAAAEAAEDSDAEGSEGLRIFRKLLDRACVVDGSRVPVPPDPAAFAPAPAAAQPEAEAFEPGTAVEHPVYGPGVVASKNLELIDGRKEWVNEIRFQDGRARSVIPRLSKPPMRRLD